MGGVIIQTGGPSKVWKTEQTNGTSKQQNPADTLGESIYARPKKTVLHRSCSLRSVPEPHL